MENKLQHTCATTREFALQLLEHITNNFSEERIIGRGGYGVVYKGVLEDGQEIAVKKLHHMPGLDDKQFRNEFNNFMRAQHQNVVRLVGYCYDIGHQRIKHNGEYIFAHVEERLLCFEYLQGGSLDKHVSDESCRLDWPSCYKIIKGVCEGLNYLHNGSKDPMYHLDLKPANILLDKDMTPKIGDFGLSRLFPSAHTYITTKIVGTRGYMPPEYIDRYQITPKFDVFSLGVIIIQIMAGRVGYSKCADIPSQEFIKLVHENWRKKMQPTMLSHTSQGVKTCIEIALRCVETDRVKRPTVAEIVNELNKIDTTIVDELNEFDDTKSSPIAQWRSLERKLGGLMHKVSDLRSKQAFNQYASSGGRLLPLPETLSAKPLRGHVYSHYLRRRNLRKKWVRWLLLSVVGWSITCFWFFLSQNFMQVEVRRKSLASMCDQYASMVQDQFSVSMYYLKALPILVSTFHHSQNPSAINQMTSAWYAKRTAFEEYAPVIFAQDSDAHVLPFDILSNDMADHHTRYDGHGFPEPEPDERSTRPHQQIVMQPGDVQELDHWSAKWATKSLPQAKWNHQMKTFIIDLLKDYNVPGYRTQNAWSKEAWTNIVNRMNQKFSLSLTLAQVKQKEQDLQKDFRTVKDLVGESGFGWDPNRMMVVAPDEVWETFGERTSKDALIWREKSFPYFDDLFILYEGRYAEGKNRHSIDHYASKAKQPSHVLSTYSPPQVADNHVRSPSAIHVTDEPYMNFPLEEEDEMGSADSSKQQHSFKAPMCSTQMSSQFVTTPEMHESKRAKRKKGNEFQERYLQLKKEEIDQFATIEEKKLEDPYSISKCVRTLEGLDGLQMSDVVMAADIFKTKENRELFLSFSSDELRLGWVKKQISRSK